MPTDRLLAALMLCAAAMPCAVRAQPSVPAASTAAAPPLAAGDPVPLAQRAAERFPQPVQVDTLIHREVLRPVEQEPVLGRVVSVVRRQDGALLVVVDARDPGWRGVLGLGARPVAVPVGALVLLGQYLALMDLTPAQLQALPTFDGAGTQPLPPDETIRVGLTRPFH